jgi:hypothetical protein
MYLFPVYVSLSSSRPWALDRPEWPDTTDGHRGPRWLPPRAAPPSWGHPQAAALLDNVLFLLNTFIRFNNFNVQYLGQRLQYIRFVTHSSTSEDDNPYIRIAAF